MSSESIAASRQELVDLATAHRASKAIVLSGGPLPSVCITCLQRWPCDAKVFYEAWKSADADVAGVKAAVEILDSQLQQQAGPDGFVELYVLRTKPWHFMLGLVRGVSAGIQVLERIRKYEQSMQVLDTALKHVRNSHQPQHNRCCDRYRDNIRGFIDAALKGTDDT